MDKPTMIQEDGGWHLIVAMPHKYIYRVKEGRTLMALPVEYAKDLAELILDTAQEGPPQRIERED